MPRTGSGPMTTIAIDLNDAGIVAVGRDGRLESGDRLVPGYAAVDDGAPVFGAQAYRRLRLTPRAIHRFFWHEMSAAPMALVAGPFSTSVDLVHAHLKSLWQRWSAGVDAVILVVPANWSNNQLGLLLGIAEELGMPVIGLVDRAVAATRCRYGVDTLWHIDLSLHDATVTRLGQEGACAVVDRQTIDGIGAERLRRAGVEYIAAQFLTRTRFDPLHDATTEQALYDGFDAWMSALQREPAVTVTLEQGGDKYAVDVERDGLARVLADSCEPIWQHMRGRMPVDAQAVIQVSDRFAGLPGLVAALDRLPRVKTYILEPDAAARGALARAGEFQSSADGVPLKTSLRWDRADVEVTVARPASPATAGAPTHILYGERVYRIGSRALSVGADLAPGEYGICLAAGVGGVSRRHCQIEAGPEGLQLIDHSRFGTRLNGHVIERSATLQAGDVIGIGTPPVELRVVAEAAAPERDDGA